jgi:hypothetical protein
MALEVMVSDEQWHFYSCGGPIGILKRTNKLCFAFCDECQSVVIFFKYSIAALRFQIPRGGCGRKRFPANTQGA